ncbi:MAG: hypothetical protein ND807_05755 [Vicinamibacterales bacterium]|nr:hypothetical protein [Vicinamibacterales bacterium]
MGDEKKSTGAKKAVMTVILGVACGAAAVMVVAARRPMPSAGVAGDAASTAAVETSAANAAAVPSAEATAAPAAVATTPDAAKPGDKANPSAKPVKKVPAKTAAAPKAPEAATVPVQNSSAATAMIPMATPQAIEEPKAAATMEVPMATVTISGCLEHEGGTFRLKDTNGVSAPKARSWKSGFLKKGSAKIDVIDSGNRLKLHDHVGQRVSVSGMLEDREMHARSVQRVSTFCE